MGNRPAGEVTVGQGLGHSREDTRRRARAQAPQVEPRRLSPAMVREGA
jgi:hypothetical protein